MIRKSHLALFTILNVVITTVPNMFDHLQHAYIQSIVLFLFLVAGFYIFWLYNNGKRLERRANYDHLTELPNRAMFQSRIESKLNLAAHQDSPDCIAILLMDLNGFKKVNDTLGHPAGDALLQQVAKRLVSVIRPDDLVARLGGDEFGVVIGGRITNISDVRPIINRILPLFNEPFTIQGHEADIGISIGVAMFPIHGQTTTELVRCADIAMYEAKRRHLGFFIYDHDIDKNSISDLDLLSCLKSSVANNELVLHYQLKQDLNTGLYSGMEALVRWKHPTLGLLQPDVFIPLAEHSGFIGKMTDWVLYQAVKDFAQIKEAGLHLDSVSVNISPYCASNGDILLTVTKVLTEFNVKPENIVFEVTETSIDHTPEQLMKVLVCLDMLGLKISIDDFGTGHSSLLYLKHLPVKEVKIDRSFVIGMLNSKQDENIVRSTINLGHDLSCIVVAEGIEDEETFNKLRELGCDEGQGYYINRPMTLSGVLTRLGSNQSIKQQV